MSISLSKKDIYWSYFAQFFSLASGLIILPMVLRMLSTEEIGMNYLMLTIGSLVALFDFGFAPQFARNITYIFSGVQELKKEDVDIISVSENVKFELLATMIETAKSIYRRLATVALVLMLSLGSLYIYHVTDGFSSVNNAFLIWIIYSISVFFNMYYLYFNALLMGKGLVKESKKAMLYSRIVYLILAFTLLLLGTGLIGLSLANLISPFIGRFLSYKYFFTPDIKNKIGPIIVSNESKRSLFKVIWYNAKKMGLISVAASCLTYMTTFVLGLYLSLKDVASYGLMIQLMGIVSTLSATFFYSVFPKINNLYIQNKKMELTRLFSLSVVIFYLLFIVGAVILLVSPILLTYIQSNAELPSITILLIFIIFNLFEKNQAIFSNMLLLENKVPFMNASLVTGAVIFIGIICTLNLNMGILGVVLSQGIPILLYSAWKWPLTTLKVFKFDFFTDILMGGWNELIRNIKILKDGRLFKIYR